MGRYELVGQTAAPLVSNATLLADTRGQPVFYLVCPPAADERTRPVAAPTAHGWRIAHAHREERTAKERAARAGKAELETILPRYLKGSAGSWNRGG